MKFTEEQLRIVRFCAVECEMQRSGEQSVSWMVDAWNYAMRQRSRMPQRRHVLALGKLVEPRKNATGYRDVRVAVGDWSNEKLAPDKVPHAMASLLTHGVDLTPAEFFREYEEIHPFVDGNGRTGQILFNWLNGTLAHPVWAPNFWDDHRRFKGYGA